MQQLVEDMNVDYRLVGLEALLSPFAQFISSQRLSMYSSNAPQAMVLEGAEFPRISTGWESQVGAIDFNGTHRVGDVLVLYVIPKFRMHWGPYRINSTPSWTIIYQDLETSEVSYMDISKYTAGSNGFGYLNDLPNSHLMRQDELITKEAVMSRAPNHTDVGLEGQHYCQGVNANVAYLDMWETAEDAFLISESFARKCTNYAISTTRINISEDMLPSNTYGTGDEYKIFPDVGELVDDTGTLMMLRKLRKDTYLADIQEESMNTPQHLHDEVYTAEANAEILDIQVYCTNRTFNRIKDDNGPYSQLIKYMDHHYAYYDKVIEARHRLTKEGYHMSPKLSNLITRSMYLKRANGHQEQRRMLPLAENREEIDFFKVDVTYGYRREMSYGGKLSGRDGAKGVIGTIIPDEDMPVDQEGVRADLVIAPESVFNRMNPGQMYEQFYNRAAHLVSERYRKGELGNDEAALEYILGFLTDIREAYGTGLRNMLSTKASKKMFLEGVKDNGIYLIIPPTCKQISPEHVLFISEKYNIGESPVSYNQHNADGTTTRVTTKVPCMIGAKYIIALGKIPRHGLSSIGLGFVNQFNTPSRPSKHIARGRLPFGNTPIRFGEDEVCMLAMCIGITTTARFLGVNANSPEAVQELGRELRTNPYPSRVGSIYMSDSEIHDRNVNISLFKHQVAVTGYDAGITNIDSEAEYE